MITIWRPVNDGNYRVKKGDVITLYGNDPQDVFSGLSDGGFVVGACAGTRLRDIWNDYSEDDEPYCWSKTRDEGIAVRLAPNKTFSKPLPLP